MKESERLASVAGILNRLNLSESKSKSRMLFKNRSHGNLAICAALLVQCQQLSKVHHLHLSVSGDSASTDAGQVPRDQSWQ